MTHKIRKFANPHDEHPLPRAGDVSIERRARTPTKGLRQRLRAALRTAGVTGKFRTDERRDGSLVILGHNVRIETAIVEFEGHPVRSVIQARK